MSARHGFTIRPFAVARRAASCPAANESLNSLRPTPETGRFFVLVFHGWNFTDVSRSAFIGARRFIVGVSSGHVAGHAACVSRRRRRIAMWRLIGSGDEEKICDEDEAAACEELPGEVFICVGKSAEAREPAGKEQRPRGREDGLGRVDESGLRGGHAWLPVCHREIRVPCRRRRAVP